MTDISTMVYSEALTHKGTWEWAGNEHNPAILKMFTDVGHGDIQDDETPWCAAFVGSVLAGLGISHTGSLTAKSYLNWGEKVKQSDVKRGDVVILHRGDPSSWQGHVGFVNKIVGDEVYILGGNQANQVNVRPYPLSRVAGFRRPKKQRKNPAQSTTLGASGAGAVGAVAAGGTIMQSAGALGETAQIIAIVGIIIAIIAFGWVFRERVIKWIEGDR